MKYCIFNNNTGFIHGFCNKAEDVETFKSNWPDTDYIQSDTGSTKKDVYKYRINLDTRLPELIPTE